MPAGIVSDRGSVFTNNYWFEIYYDFNIKYWLSTAFHLQIDRQTEYQNQTLEHYLRVYYFDDQSNWAMLLSLTEYIYSNASYSSIGYSLFYAIYSYNPDFYINIKDSSPEEGGPAISERVSAVKEQVQWLDELYISLIDWWQSIIKLYAKFYNKKHKSKKFNIEDLIILLTKNLKQKRPSKKLSYKNISPFRVKLISDKQAYRLFLPITYRIHPVFHVSLLELYNRQECDDILSVLPSPELVNNMEEWEVKDILQ